jgi:hypothetical protein
MKTEEILKDPIQTFDHLLINDIWKLINLKKGYNITLGTSGERQRNTSK